MRGSPFAPTFRKEGTVKFAPEILGHMVQDTVWSESFGRFPGEEGEPGPTQARGGHNFANDNHDKHRRRDDPIISTNLREGELVTGHTLPLPSIRWWQLCWRFGPRTIEAC